jgi:8-oxo-dGTP pyrophosphatase MutT (NUDIX family)
VGERVLQAGGIVLRREGDCLFALLVRSRKDPSIWIFPKGHIDPGESAETTALRETYEESGVHGEVIAPVGEPLEFDSGRVTVSVQYFLIRPRLESPSPEGREKQWFRFPEAVTQLSFENARRLLREAGAVFPED